jgi:probable rRNA maturation factor
MSQKEVLIDLQLALPESTSLPTEAQITQWATAAVQGDDSVEICARIVDLDESQELNRDYRGKDKPTNVLSFPFEAPEHIDLNLLGGFNLLGDLVLCAPVIEQEAKEQGKTLEAHWAHMIVHGTLHLQGYDHIEDDEAEAMEQLEVQILGGLGFSNPYL